MNSLRRLSYVAFGVACTHLVFGAIVRISGSGMGCGDHWPRCYGSFFPPLNRPDLIVEVSHRYLAVILLTTLIGLALTAWTRRSEAGVGGPRGVLRSASLAVALGVTAAILGAVTVKLTNAPFATLAHWTVAMSLVATVVATVIRAGGFGGASVRAVAVAGRTRRAAFAAAVMALATVVMGGLTAKYPGASVACLKFPLCGANPDVQAAAVWVQGVHRVLAVVLVFHLLGVMIGVRKRGESPAIWRAAQAAFGLGVLQLLIAGAMIGMHLPPVLRSLHEATGVSIWIATFALAYLARISGDGHGVREPRVVPQPRDLVDAGAVRASTPATAFSTAVAEPRLVEKKEPWQAELLVAENELAVRSEVLRDLTTEDTEGGTEDTEESVPAPLSLDAGRSFTLGEPQQFTAEVAESAEEDAAIELFSASSASSAVIEVAREEPVVERHIPHSIAVIIARGADL
ncbi:MAG: COX15/CtaA family protein [Gemmatimonadaceae bacterium]